MAGPTHAQGFHKFQLPSHQAACKELESIVKGFGPMKEAIFRQRSVGKTLPERVEIAREIIAERARK